MNIEDEVATIAKQLQASDSLLIEQALLMLWILYRDGAVTKERVRKMIAGEIFGSEIDCDCDLVSSRRCEYTVFTCLNSA